MRLPSFLNVDIYPVTGRELCPQISDEQVIAALARGGAKIVQLREKKLTVRQFYELAMLYRRETRKHGMLLIINDRADIAAAVEADGVHLGQDDLPISAARKLLGPDAIIGGSSHSVAEALEVQKQGATYVNIGPLFPTPTKPGMEAVGLDPVREAARSLSIPFTVMGGINQENIAQVAAAGAKRIGVVSAIFAAKDIAQATLGLRNIMANAVGAHSAK
ncbi:MAG: thiamine phosphate synthase [Nitrospinae bacterium]|nr:thiamine phosphate synthase [Nitrospinota bacterium]